MAYSDFNENYQDRTAGLSDWLKSQEPPAAPSPDMAAYLQNQTAKNAGFDTTEVNANQTQSAPVDFGSMNPNDKAISLAQEAFQPGSAPIQQSQQAQPQQQETPFRDSALGRMISSPGTPIGRMFGPIFEGQRNQAISEYMQHLPSDPMEAIQGLARIDPRNAKEYLPELLAANAKEPEIMRQKALQKFLQSVSENGLPQAPGQQAAPAQRPTQGPLDLGLPAQEQPAPQSAMAPIPGFKDASPLQAFDKYPEQTMAESGGNPNAVSPAGAVGPKQLMPATAADPGFGVKPAQNNSPQENVRVGDDYLDAMVKRYGNVPDGLAAYNWGPGKFDAWKAAGSDPSQLPAETKAYVEKLTPQIQARMAQGGSQPSATPLGQFNQQMTPEEGMALKMAAIDPKYADNALAAFGKRFQNTPYTAAAKAQMDLAHGMITQQQYDEMEKAGLFKQGDSNLPSSIQEANAYEAAKKLGTPEGNQRAADIAMFAKTSGVADPAVLSAAVDAVGQNDVNSATLFSRGSLADKAAIISAVRQKYPNWNQRQFEAIADFNNGTHGDQVKFTSNVTEHLELSRELFKALDNGNVPMFNKLAQTWAQQTGSEVPTDFQSAVNIVGQEMVKSIVPSGGGVSDRDEAQKAFDIAKSPAQGEDAINTIEKMMKTQIRGNERQFINSTGGNKKDFLKLISPQAASVLYPESKDESAPAQQANAAPALDMASIQSAAAAELARRGGK